ncbi:MAG TPA: hypothetical protein DEQ04_00005 [Thermovirga lienii]|nr:hypothetical protein [Thermovirga lienii]
MKVPTIAALALEEIRNMILSGRFSPGEKINIDQLSRELSISKTPIREALKELGREGLLSYQAREGWSVASHSPEEFSQLEELQQILRSHISTHIYKFVDNLDFNELENINENIIHFVNTKQYDRAFMENDKFHMKIYGAYPNKIILEELRQVNNAIGLQRRFILKKCIEKDPKFYLDNLKKQHAEILDSLKSRNAERIKASFDNHFSTLTQMLEKQMEEF